MNSIGNFIWKSGRVKSGVIAVFIAGRCRRRMWIGGMDIVVARCFDVLIL
jgi:hypothetical protein